MQIYKVLEKILPILYIFPIIRFEKSPQFIFVKNLVYIFNTNFRIFHSINILILIFIKATLASKYLSYK